MPPWIFLERVWNESLANEEVNHDPNSCRGHGCHWVSITTKSITFAFVHSMLLPVHETLANMRRERESWSFVAEGRSMKLLYPMFMPVFSVPRILGEAVVGV
jgi:hypothetical protein